MSVQTGFQGMTVCIAARIGVYTSVFNSRSFTVEKGSGLVVGRGLELRFDCLFKHLRVAWSVTECQALRSNRQLNPVPESSWETVVSIETPYESINIL